VFVIKKYKKNNNYNSQPPKIPAGHIRSYGRRPDGLSLIPWINGIPVSWDVTVIHPLADSYLNKVSITAGDEAELAANRKYEKYADTPSSHLFQPIVFETLRHSYTLYIDMFLVKVFSPDWVNTKC